MIWMSGISLTNARYDGMHLDKDSAAGMFKMLHDINQDFKSVPNSAEVYFIKGTKIYVSQRGQLYHVYGEIQPVKKKTEGFVKMLEDMDILLAINSKKFFEFQKEYKNNIESAVITPSGIVFKTLIPDIELSLESNEFTKVARENIEKIQDIQSKLSDPWEFDFTYEQFTDIKDIKTALMLYFNTESGTITVNQPSDEVYVALKFNSKYFLKYTKTSSCKVNLYNSIEDEKVFIVEIILDSKKYRSHQYFKVVYF
jgi:hypothetical protein